jgi:hypothetical protein
MYLAYLTAEEKHQVMFGTGSKTGTSAAVFQVDRRYLKYCIQRIIRIWSGTPKRVL